MPSIPAYALAAARGATLAAGAAAATPVYQILPFIATPVVP